LLSYTRYDFYAAPAARIGRPTEVVLRSWSLVANLFVLAGLALSTTGCTSLVIGGAATAGVAVAQERGLSGAARDTVIQAKINELWFQHNVEMFRKLGLTVNEGRVLVTGRASTPEMRLDAVRLAWQVDGVTEVINEVEVDDTSSLQDVALDTWIAAQLRGRLMFDREISSINYTIDTVNGVIYLMGSARNQAELDRVTGHARSLPHVKRVVSYVRVVG
jgi:osmotically-inducible protein OsmY